MSCLLSLVLNSCCNVCFCHAAVFHLNRGQELKKSLYLVKDKQTLPPTQPLIMTGSVLVCNLLNPMLHEIAFQCSNCVCLPCLVRRTLPLEHNPSPPISSLRGLCHPPQVGSIFFFFFKGNRMTKTEIRLCYDASHPKKQDVFPGAWLC